MQFFPDGDWVFAWDGGDPNAVCEVRLRNGQTEKFVNLLDAIRQLLPELYETLDGLSDGAVRTATRSVEDFFNPGPAQLDRTGLGYSARLDRTGRSKGVVRS